MGIRDKRLSKAINKILREELQQGNLPSSKEFSWRLSNYLDQHDLSRPEFNFKSVRRGTKAISSEYNGALDSIQVDLETLYESTVELHNAIGKNLSKFEVDKSKVEYEISALENKLKELILMYGKSGFLTSVFDVFDDMSKVDVAKSDVNIDVKKHEVSISDIKNTSTRIVPRGTAQFRILDEIANSVDVVTVSGTPSNVFNDNANNVWQQNVVSDTEQATAGYFSYDFDEKQIVNRISISLNSVKSTFLRVEFSPDNINWFTLPYYEEGVEVLDEYTFDFPSITMEQFRILMKKDEPDNQSDTQYSFTYGIKNLQLFRLEFAEKAVIYSTPLEVEVPSTQNFSINKVSLLTEEFLPNGTDIQYSIALPVTQGIEPEWKAISPVNRESPKHEQIIDFKNITRAPAVRFQIDPTLSIGEYEMISMYSNGVNFYKIGEVPLAKKIIAGTERLFPGNQTWGVRYFQGEFTDHATHIPSLADWSKPLSNVQYDYVKIEDGKPGVLLNGKTHTLATSYMCTLGIFSEKKEEVVSIKPATTEPIAIYMNGEKLYEGTPSSGTNINLLFTNGWNEIIVLSYTRNPTAANGVTVDLAFDPRKHGANIYSQAKPMQKVSLADLRFNIKSNDRNKYAIEMINEQQVIILNHAVSGLEYDFYFNQVEGDVKDTILFKAEFKRDREISSISPKLKKYYLRFS